MSADRPLALTLQVRNVSQLANGGPLSVVLDRRSATIGRASSTDWSLPDPELQVAGRYRVTGYPETFVIDRNGMVVAHEVGPRHWDAPDSIAAFRTLIARGEWVGL